MRVQKTLSKALLSATALCVGLAAAEAGLRARYFGAAGLLHPSRYSPRSLPGTPLAQGDDLRPGAKGWFKGAPFSVNARGMRDAERADRAEKGAYRVAVVGDSFTMGSGVADGQTYPARLEAILGQRCAPRRFEALNFGVGGHDLAADAADVCGRVKALSPDLVVVGFNESDDLPLTAEPDDRPDLGRRLQRLAPDSFLLALAAETSRAREQKGWVARTASAIDWARFDSELGGLRRCAPAPVVFALLRHPGVPALPWAARTREALARAGYAVIDTTPAFEGKDLKSFRIYASDAHPNAAADEIYAQTIADALLSTVLRRDCARQTGKTAQRERRV